MSDLLHEGAGDFAEDTRWLLLEMERDLPGVATVAPDCRPPLDVLENATAVEVLVDIPGVPADSLRVAIRRSTLMVVGSKPVGDHPPAGKFHLAERSYGRFARAVRLGGAFDASLARAVMARGELRVILPLITDRRGHITRVPVERS